MLHPDGQDLTGRPRLERKQALDDLGLVGPAWAVNRWYPGGGDDVFQACAENGHEGVVAKRLDSINQAGRRTRYWLKRKCPAWLDFDAPRRRPALTE